MAKDIDVNAVPPSADQMRMALLEAQMAEAEKQEKLQAKANQEVTKFTDSFLKDQVSEDEIAMVRRLVMNAVKNGKYEAHGVQLPFGTVHRQWPSHQQRRSAMDRNPARQSQAVLRALPEVREAAGYKLKAMIINFPGGMPGDVGFFIQLGAGNQVAEASMHARPSSASASSSPAAVV